RRWFWR
nr:Chain A, cRW3 cationic antimicrobial peptide [unidentified]